MSEQKRVSETAETTALIRAVACFEPDEKIRGRDELAKLFLSEERREKLPGEDWRHAVKERVTAKSKGLYEYVIARTAFFDELFKDALNENVPQIVLLGAGYDSRAYRFLSSVKIFEVDASFTQERKTSILKINGIDCDKVVFVTVDFEKDGLFERLVDREYDPAKRTLFLWEGVTPYLSSETVRAILMAIKQGCRESILAFDYLNIPLNGGNEIILQDERVLFGMGKVEIENWLSSLGYRVLENLEPAEIAARYLTGTDGRIFGDIKKTMNFIKTAA